MKHLKTKTMITRSHSFKLRPIIAFFIALMFMGSCKKDEVTDKELEGIEEVEEVEELKPIEGGIIYSSEAVSLKIDNFSLQETYPIIFGNQELTAVRSSEDELIFQVPALIDLGEIQMVIPTLDNYTVSYEVKQTVLSATPNEIMTSFFTDITDSVTVFDDLEEVAYLEEYNTALQEYYNGLSDNEKQVMAEYYIANEAFFTRIFSDELTGKNESKDVLDDYKIAVVIMGASVAIAIINPDPITRAVAVGVAIYSFKKAKAKYSAFADQNIKIIDFALNSVSSQFDKNRTSEKDEAYLAFDDNVAKGINVENISRPLVSEDKTDTAQGVSEFFSSLEAMNGVVLKINEAITFVNENLFFSNISLLEKSELSETASASTMTLTEEQLKALNFSVSNSNLSLTKVAMDANNNLLLTLKIKDGSDVAEEFVTSQLNFTYADTFNQISGGFPIRVNKFGIEIEGNLEFGEVYISKKVSRSVSIKNPFNEALQVTGISLPKDFSTDWDSGIIAANSTKTISVTFEPTTEKEYSGTFSINNNLDDKNNTAAITGKGVLSELSLEGDLAFGDVQIDGNKTLDLTITNNGSEDFSLTDNLVFPDGFIPTALQTNLASGASQVMPIRFSPTKEQEYKGEIVINDGLGNRITAIAVSGAGIENTYFGKWNAISFDGKPMGTKDQEYLCNRLISEFTLERFYMELTGDNLTIQYTDYDMSYGFSYSNDENGNIICSTLELDQPSTDRVVYNQTVPYTFTTATTIQFNFIFDNGTDIYPSSLTLELLQNGNMRVVIIVDEDDNGDTEVLTIEMEKL